MKWLCIPVILFPYSVLGMLYCLFSGTLMESVFQNNGFLCILALLAWALIGFACAFLVGIRGARTLDCLRFARFAMILKLVQIPAYCIIFVLAALFSLTIFTIGFTIALAFFDGIAILMTGIPGVFSIRKSYQSGVLLRSDCLIHSLLQFVFCADVVSSIYLYRKIKRTSTG